MQSCRDFIICKAADSPHPRKILPSFYPFKSEQDPFDSSSERNIQDNGNDILKNVHRTQLNVGICHFTTLDILLHHGIWALVVDKILKLLARFHFTMMVVWHLGLFGQYIIHYAIATRASVTIWSTWFLIFWSGDCLPSVFVDLEVRE